MMFSKSILSPEQLYQAANEMRAEITLLRYKNERAKAILKYLTDLYFEKLKQQEAE